MSILSKLSSLFPSFRRTYAPNVPTPEERAARLISDAKDAIDRARAKPRPSTDEKIPVNYSVGVAGKIWFLPYLDSTTGDTPEIRAAMRLMRHDPWVKASWVPQILSVSSEDWQIQAGEPGNPESEEQADAFRAAIEDSLAEGMKCDGMMSLVNAICAPLGSEGHSVAEPVWGVARRGKLKGMVVPVKVAARDTDQNTGDVRLLGDEFGNVTHVVPRRTTGTKEYSIEEFIYSRYLTVFDEPLGEAAFRPAYSKWWMLDTVEKLRIIHTEKKMAGMLVGEYEADDDKGPLETALARAKAATWMSIPAGTRVQAVQLSTASEPDYKSHAESLRDAIVTGIAFGTLQMLTSTANGDQRGSADVQKMVTDLGPWLLMTIVSGAVNTQLSPRFIDYNYPYAVGGKYPKLTFGAVANQALIELIQILTGAQQLGFKPSKKHYAKALSIQESDPNDPDDQLGGGDPMGGMGGGMGGGLPPGGGGGQPFGGGGGGAPPFDPMTGGGEQFGESSWESFDWQSAPSRGKSGVKAVWAGPGQRRPLYGAAARKALSRNSQGSGGGMQPVGLPGAQAPVAAPVASSAPSLPGPTAGPLPGPGEPAPKKGGKLSLVGRAAKAAVYRTTQGKIYGLAKTGQAVGFAANRIGRSLKSLGWVERNLLFGAGKSLEQSGRRMIDQSRQTAALAASGHLGAASKRLASGMAKAAGVQFGVNRRRYGFIPAAVMEAAFWGLKLGPIGAGVGLAATALAGPVAGTVAGVSAVAAAEKVLGPALSPILRKLITLPFRRGKGKGGTNAPHRRLSKRMEKAAAKNDRAARVGRAPTGGFTAAPAAVSRAARNDRSKAGPGALYTPGQATSRTRRYSEEFEAFAAGYESADLLAAARETMDNIQLANNEVPMEVSDADLAELLAHLFEYVEQQADTHGEAVQQFAEERGAEAVWDVFDEGNKARRAVEKVISELEPEDLEGLYVYFNPDGPKFWIDQMDWHDGYGGRDVIEAAEDALDVECEEVGGGRDGLVDGPAVLVCNEGPKPPGEGWVKLLEDGVEAFGWQGARSKRGGVKAVGTGEQAGQVVYGAAARAKLERKAGAGKRQETPRNVRYDVTDGEGNVTSKRETDVSPERARAMARASALAATEPVTGERPTQVKVTKQRRPKAVEAIMAPLEAAAEKAKGGDREAAKVVSEAGGKVAQAAAEGAAKLPPLTRPQVAAIRGAWNKSAKGMGQAQMNEGKSLIGELASNLHNDTSAVGKLAKWVAKTGFAGVKALAKFSFRMAKLAGRGFLGVLGVGRHLGAEMAQDVARATGNEDSRQIVSNVTSGVLGGIGRAVGAVARPVLRGAGKVLGPAAWYVGGAAAGAAILAAPALAVSAGLLPWAAALALAPVAAGGAWLAIRGGARRGSKAVGQNFYGYKPEEYGLPRQGVLFDGMSDLFGEDACRLVEEFAWDDWKQVDGQKWKSPGGRVLSDAEYQKLRNDGADEPADAESPKVKPEESQSNAVRKYGGVWGFQINERLRSGAMTDEDRATVAELDTAIRSSSNPEARTTFRGLKTDPFTLNGSLPRVGETFAAPGYLSTSESEAQARTFGDKAVIHISVPEGFPALSYQKQTGDQGEREWLLPRNTRLRLDRIERRGDGSTVYHVSSAGVADLSESPSRMPRGKAEEVAMNAALEGLPVPAEVLRDHPDFATKFDHLRPTPKS